MTNPFKHIEMENKDELVCFTSNKVRVTGRKKYVSILANDELLSRWTSTTNVDRADVLSVSCVGEQVVFAAMRTY